MVGVVPAVVSVAVGVLFTGWVICVHFAVHAASTLMVCSEAGVRLTLIGPAGVLVNCPGTGIFPRFAPCRGTDLGRTTPGEGAVAGNFPPACSD